MVQQVQVPHSVVDGKVPLPSELVEGGLAVNLPTRRIFSKDYQGNVISLLGDVEKDQVIEALGGAPVMPSGTQLPGPATDLPTAIALLNAIRTLLISAGLGT